jgi:hypothetical protein
VCAFLLFSVVLWAGLYKAVSFTALLLCWTLSRGRNDNFVVTTTDCMNTEHKNVWRAELYLTFVWFLIFFDVISEVRLVIWCWKSYNLWWICKVAVSRNLINSVTWKEDVELFIKSSSTRWFKYDLDKLWLVYTQIVPVIFEPPCILKILIKIRT